MPSREWDERERIHAEELDRAKRKAWADGKAEGIAQGLTEGLTDGSRDSSTEHFERRLIDAKPEGLSGWYEVPLEYFSPQNRELIEKNRALIKAVLDGEVAEAMRLRAMPDEGQTRG